MYKRQLLGELVAPVLVAAVVGLATGVGCARVALGELSLESLTAAPGPPSPVVPWWTVLWVVALVGCSAALALAEWRRVRRTPLAELLRT
ncbi:hypothetical protein NOCD_20120 [Nocardioides cavernae]|nr:hypothetical protein [Nocardioides cavernae]MCK9825800.1 hypothetical protein [Nocardioides cavernae]